MNKGIYEKRALIRSFAKCYADLKELKDKIATVNNMLNALEKRAQSLEDEGQRYSDQLKEK